MGSLQERDKIIPKVFVLALPALPFCTSLASEIHVSAAIVDVRLLNYGTLLGKELIFPEINFQ